LPDERDEKENLGIMKELNKEEENKVKKKEL